MRARLVVATVVVLAVQMMVAWSFAIIGIHGPSGLALTALIYIIGAWSLTAWIATRHRSLLALLGVGLVSVAVAPGIVAGLARMERIRYERQIAATIVSDVRDEPILSTTSGRPIGVRVNYNIKVPNHGYYATTPWLTSRDPKTERLSVSPSFQGFVDKPFQAGETRAVVFDLFPRILTFVKNERCVDTTSMPNLPENIGASRLAIMISDTKYGATYRGGHEEFTTGSYDLAEMYRGVLAEGLNVCQPLTPSP